MNEVAVAQGPNNKLMYHTNWNVLKESRLGIDMYTKSGSMVMGLRDEQTGLMGKQYSVSMRNTLPYTAYLDVIHEPEAASIVTNNNLGQFTGNRRILPGNRIVSEVQFSPKALAEYDYDGLQSYQQHRGVSDRDTIIAEQRALSIESHKYGQMEPQGQYDAMLFGMALAENMRLESGDTADAKRAFTRMLPEYVNALYLLDKSFQKDMQKTEDHVFFLDDAYGQIEVNKVKHLASLVSHEISQADRQSMVAYLNGIVVQKMAELQQTPVTQKQVSDFLSGNHHHTLYQQWSGHMAEQGPFFTDLSRNMFESIKQYDNQMQRQNDMDYLKQVNQLPGHSRTGISGIERVHIAAGQPQGIETKQTNVTVQHPNRGYEFEHIIAQNHEPSADMEFGG